MKKLPKKNKNSAEQQQPAKNRVDKKIDLPRHAYPRPSEKDDQFKNQPEFIEPNNNRRG